MKVFCPKKEDMVEPPQWFIDYVFKTYDYLGRYSRPVLDIIAAEYKIYLEHAPMWHSQPCTGIKEGSVRILFRSGGSIDVSPVNGSITDAVELCIKPEKSVKLG